MRTCSERDSTIILITERPMVQLVSGEDLQVLSDAEVRWFTTTRDTYLKQTRFSDTTDLRDLDRLLGLELMIFRWTQWMSRGLDYDGFELENESAMRRNIRDYSEQITRLKNSMGLSKQSRDEAANQGDFSAYISNLKQRARAFGIHREHQLTRALTLVNDLSTIVGTFDRCDAEERAKFGFEDEAEIVAWVRDVMLPEFREVDEHFRANEQRYWVRDI